MLFASINITFTSQNHVYTQRHITMHFLIMCVMNASHLQNLFLCKAASEVYSQPLRSLELRSSVTDGTSLSEQSLMHFRHQEPSTQQNSAISQET